jgi:hypothetical protein
MIQLVSGSILLLLGAVLLIRGFRSSRQEGAGPQRGFLGRFGTLMLGLIAAFLGVALLLPARDATPTPGVAPNPVDEAVQEGGE